MGRIPDRWEAYSAVGSVVLGTRFLPFKVPLKEIFCRQLPQNLWFTPKSLIGMMKDKGSELGLVIDLTNTTRYYQAEEILQENIEYKKIFTEGHNVPSSAVKQEFFDAVDRFLTENKDNNRIIGVHCTHGLNRTGYMVCRYMIDRLNMQPSDAIEAFNQARGHNIERENYLDDLNGVNGSSTIKPVADSRRSSHRQGGGGEERVGAGSRRDTYNGDNRPWQRGRANYQQDWRSASSRSTADTQSSWRAARNGDPYNRYESGAIGHTSYNSYRPGGYGRPVATPNPYSRAPNEYVRHNQSVHPYGNEYRPQYSDYNYTRDETYSNFSRY